MIRKIEISAFKSIAAQEIELGQLNVFVGANGSGKSNILEAIGVLSAAAFGNQWRATA
jgi:AAA15 family ATPase/GTPase